MKIPSGILFCWKGQKCSKNNVIDVIQHKGDTKINVLWTIQRSGTGVLWRFKKSVGGDWLYRRRGIDRLWRIWIFGQMLYIYQHCQYCNKKLCWDCCHSKRAGRDIWKECVEKLRQKLESQFETFYNDYLKVQQEYKKLESIGPQKWYLWIFMKEIKSMGCYIA